MNVKFHSSGVKKDGKASIASSIAPCLYPAVSEKTKMFLGSFFLIFSFGFIEVIFLAQEFEKTENKTSKRKDLNLI